jgi:hypothetical protein
MSSTSAAVTRSFDARATGTAHAVTRSILGDDHILLEPNSLSRSL